MEESGEGEELLPRGIRSRAGAVQDVVFVCSPQQEVALISYCCQEVLFMFFYFFSSRSVILVGQARQGLALLFFM